MKIGQIIKEVRKAKGFSQGEFAKLIDRNQGYLSQVEKGRVSTSLPILNKISKVTGVPTYYFLFKGLEEKDIPEHKREAYRMLSPSISGLLEGLFI